MPLPNPTLTSAQADALTDAATAAASPLLLTNRQLLAESEGLALRAARQQTTVRDATLIHVLTARLIGARVELERARGVA